ncbi:MAG: TonB-dependent receptor plug domain-containing protein [Ignavibacteria bacterium]|nr:TonB-dependent receptor plug domain-containing protein [Ignavibacteria bacterium]
MKSTISKIQNNLNEKIILHFTLYNLHFALKTLFTTLLFFLINFQVHAQKNDSIYIPPFDTNKIKEAPYLSNNSDTTSNQFFIWNDKRNLGEVMNEKSGYFVNYFNPGGRNLINYNGFTDYHVGIFRDGIQINDNYFGGFDIENISINEIEKIEEISNVSSFLYGINTTGKAINVITKDIFQPDPFSQLRFSQDRHGSLNADVLFSIPFSKKLNVQIGANNHVIEGRFTNTDFGVWRARSKVNFFLSPKFNARLNFDYTKIKRGLFEGVVYSNDLDSIIDGDIAKVVNSDSYERLTNYYYDISLVGRLFKNRNSLTKLKLYSNNSLREYRDEENRSNPNKIYIQEDYHSLVYGIDLKQNILYKINKDFSIDFTTGLNTYLNSFELPSTLNRTEKLNENYFTAFQKIDLKYNKSFISGFLKYINGGIYYKNNYLSFGTETNINLYQNGIVGINVIGGFNRIERPFSHSDEFIAPQHENEYYEIGTHLSFYDTYFKFVYFKSIELYHEPNKGYMVSIKYDSEHFNGYINFDYNEHTYSPKYYIKSDISYKDLFFNKHLVLRLGFNIKYLNDLLTSNYDQKNYRFPYSQYSEFHIKNSFNVDFYIGARIGKANVNFTIANIFNNFNYNTYLYPEDDRYGFLRAISRFTIVWDFLN